MAHSAGVARFMILIWRIGGLDIRMRLELDWNSTTKGDISTSKYEFGKTIIHSFVDELDGSKMIKSSYCRHFHLIPLHWIYKSRSVVHMTEKNDLKKMHPYFPKLNPLYMHPRAVSMIHNDTLNIAVQLWALQTPLGCRNFISKLLDSSFCIQWYIHEVKASINNLKTSLRIISAIEMPKERIGVKKMEDLCFI